MNQTRLGNYPSGILAMREEAYRPLDHYGMSDGYNLPFVHRYIHNADRLKRLTGNEGSFRNRDQLAARNPQRALRIERQTGKQCSEKASPIHVLKYIAALALLATGLHAQPTIDKNTQIRNFLHTHHSSSTIGGQGGQLDIQALLTSILSGGATGTKLATVNTSLTSGLCLEADANGNIKTAASGAACGSATGGVTSFISRTGAVVAVSGDYSFSLISGTAQANQGGTSITSYTAGDMLVATGAATLSKVNNNLQVTGYVNATAPVSAGGCGLAWDGATDDRAALQACINGLTTGGLIVFPAGVGLISSPGVVIAKNNIRLRGAGGYNNTNLCYSGSSPGICHSLSSLKATGAYAAGASVLSWDGTGTGLGIVHGAELTDLEIDAAALAPRGVTLKYAVGFFVHNVSIHDWVSTLSTDAGLYVTSAAALGVGACGNGGGPGQIDNVNVQSYQGTGANGIKFGDQAVTATDVCSINLTNAFVSTNAAVGNHGVWLASTDSIKSTNLQVAGFVEQGITSITGTSATTATLVTSTAHNMPVGTVTDGVSIHIACSTALVAGACTGTEIPGLEGSLSATYVSGTTITISGAYGLVNGVSYYAATIAGTDIEIGVAANDLTDNLLTNVLSYHGIHSASANLGDPYTMLLGYNYRETNGTGTASPYARPGGGLLPVLDISGGLWNMSFNTESRFHPVKPDSSGFIFSGGNFGDFRGILDFTQVTNPNAYPAILHNNTYIATKNFADDQQFPLLGVDASNYLVLGNTQSSFLGYKLPYLSTAGVVANAASGLLSSVTASSMLQYLRRKPNVSTPTYEFAALDYLSAPDYAWTQTPGGSVSAGATTVTLTPGPLGVASTFANTYIRLANGTGTAEAAVLTGGTCDGTGQSSCTVIFTAANTHSGAWTIATASAGIKEAVNMLPTKGGRVRLPSTSSPYDIYQTLFIGDGSASGPSTRMGVQLIGDGAGSVQSSGDGRESIPGFYPTQLYWRGPAAGTMMEVDGPYGGLRLDGISFQCNGANRAGRALFSTHSYNSFFIDLAMSGCSSYSITHTAWENPTNVVVGANANLWENVRTVTDGSSTSSGMEIGRVTGASCAGSCLDVAQNLYHRLRFAAGSAGVALKLNFTDSSTFEQLEAYGGSSSGTGILVTEGPTGFPQALTCIMCSVGGNTKLDDSGWGSSNNGMMFVPYNTDFDTSPPPFGTKNWSFGYSISGHFWGLWKQIPNAYTSIASSTAIASTSSETAFSKNYQIPAGAIDRAGIKVRVRASGHYSTTGTPTLFIGLKLGGTGTDGQTFALVPPTTTANNSSGVGWSIDGETIIRTAGASGVVQNGSCNGGFQSVAVLGCTWPNNAYALDTTVAETVYVTAKWSASDAANTVTMDTLSVEVLQSGAQ